jgi:hypothetical protein
LEAHVQVVNGFFWKGNPVRALDRGPDHLTALGVSSIALVLRDKNKFTFLGF